VLVRQYREPFRVKEIRVGAQDALYVVSNDNGLNLHLFDDEFRGWEDEE
jgi:hypothetical protein